MTPATAAVRSQAAQLLAAAFRSNVHRCRVQLGSLSFYAFRAHFFRDSRVVNPLARIAAQSILTLAAATQLMPAFFRTVGRNAEETARDEAVLIARLAFRDALRAGATEEAAEGVFAETFETELQ